MRLAIVITFIFSLYACAGAPANPKITLYGFTENNYPCVNVEFPDQIRYEGMRVKERGDNIVIVYDAEMPNYKIQISKLYSKGGGFSTESLASLKTEASKVYEIYDAENSPEKSAVITLEETDGSLYLKGSVAEFMQNDRAVRVDIYKEVKGMGVFRKNSIDKWKNSTTGNRTIQNMKAIVDSVYNKMSVVECEYKDGVDIQWWK